MVQLPVDCVHPLTGRSSWWSGLPGGPLTCVCSPSSCSAPGGLVKHYSASPSPVAKVTDPPPLPPGSGKPFSEGATPCQTAPGGRNNGLRLIQSPRTRAIQHAQRHCIADLRKFNLLSAKIYVLFSFIHRRKRKREKSNDRQK